MEEGPKVTLDIQCLRQGGGAALTSTNNYFLHRRGSGGAQAITLSLPLKRLQALEKACLPINYR